MFESEAARSRRRVVVRAGLGVAAPLGLAVGLVLVLPFDAYPYVKAFHLAAAAAWISAMAGLLALYGWHRRDLTGSSNARIAELLGRLESGLLLRVVNPAMVITWGLGGWLAWTGEWWGSAWLHGKLGLVLVLSGVHGYVAAERRRLALGRPRGTEGFYFVVNVVTVTLAVGAVLLVVVKPF